MELTSIKNIRLGQVLKEAGYVTEEDIARPLNIRSRIRECVLVMR